MHTNFEKPINCKFKIENTKTKIGKSEKYLKPSQFYVGISILHQFLNFDFCFSGLIFIFLISFRLDSTDFRIPDLNSMKTSVGHCEVCMFTMLLKWPSSRRIFKSCTYCSCKNNSALEP